MRNEFKMVPVELTEEMKRAARNAPLPMVLLDSISARQDLEFESRFNAAVAAAPQPPAIGGEPEVVGYGFRNTMLGRSPVMMELRPDIPENDQYGGRLWDALITQDDHRAHLAAQQAEIERLRNERTDWQARCLKRGFDYVRESDDHYVLADVPEMAALLSELLGVDVRSKDNEDYGQTVSDLEDQVDAGVDAFHRAYEAKKDRDQLKARCDELEGLLREVVALDPRGEFMGWQLDGRIDAALNPAKGSNDEAGGETV